MISGTFTGYYQKDKKSFEIRHWQIPDSIDSAFAPLGTLFETLALIFSDAVISALIEEKKKRSVRYGQGLPMWSNGNFFRSEEMLNTKRNAQGGSPPRLRLPPKMR